MVVVVVEREAIVVAEVGREKKMKRGKGIGGRRVVRVRGRRINGRRMKRWGRRRRISSILPN